ncbi:hypothetical protein [Halovenus sp. HT40]|uniref:hypothetical protein n=1 Tax=Halovenus sp. HT40 TaxID=3126691 RepID=UPI00300E96DD
MESPGFAWLDEKASSETLGVAVLIGMTVLVTAGLGLGVIFMDEQDQKRTAEVDFTFLSDSMVVQYQDGTERRAGSLFVEGPRNNVSWADLDDSRGPDDMVNQSSRVQVTADNFGATPRDNQRYALVFITEEGERVVLASVNDDAEEGAGESPTGPDAPAPGG